jgi:hypothetical protein
MPRSQLEEPVIANAVGFNTVLTIGLESSPVADALAGLRANEAGTSPIESRQLPAPRL